MTIREYYRDYLLNLQSIYPLLEATAITDQVFGEIASIKRADLIKDPNLLLDPLIHLQLEKAKAELLTQ